MQTVQTRDSPGPVIETIVVNRTNDIGAPETLQIVICRELDSRHHGSGAMARSGSGR
jgi:hypothetical protein